MVERVFEGGEVNRGVLFFERFFRKVWRVRGLKVVDGDFRSFSRSLEGI